MTFLRNVLGGTRYWRGILRPCKYLGKVAPLLKSDCEIPVRKQCGNLRVSTRAITMTSTVGRSSPLHKLSAVINASGVDGLSMLNHSLQSLQISPLSFYQLCELYHRLPYSVQRPFSKATHSASHFKTHHATTPTTSRQDDSWRNCADQDPLQGQK